MTKRHERANDADDTQRSFRKIVAVGALAGAALLGACTPGASSKSKAEAPAAVSKNAAPRRESTAPNPVHNGDDSSIPTELVPNEKSIENQRLKQLADQASRDVASSLFEYLSSHDRSKAVPYNGGLSLGNKNHIDYDPLRFPSPSTDEYESFMLTDPVTGKIHLNAVSGFMLPKGAEGYEDYQTGSGYYNSYRLTITGEPNTVAKPYTASKY